MQNRSREAGIRERSSNQLMHEKEPEIGCKQRCRREKRALA